MGASAMEVERVAFESTVRGAAASTERLQQVAADQLRSHGLLVQDDAWVQAGKGFAGLGLGGSLRPVAQLDRPWRSLTVQIAWELFHRRSQVVVYRGVTQGHIARRRQDGSATEDLEGCVRGAVDALVQREAFQQALDEVERTAAESLEAEASADPVRVVDSVVPVGPPPPALELIEPVRRRERGWVRAGLGTAAVGAGLVVASNVLWQLNRSKSYDEQALMRVSDVAGWSLMAVGTTFVIKGRAGTRRLDRIVAQ